MYLLYIYMSNIQPNIISFLIVIIFDIKINLIKFKFKFENLHKKNNYQFVLKKKGTLYKINN